MLEIAKSVSVTPSIAAARSNSRFCLGLTRASILDCCGAAIDVPSAASNCTANCRRCQYYAIALQSLRCQLPCCPLLENREKWGTPVWVEREFYESVRGDVATRLSLVDFHDPYQE